MKNLLRGVLLLALIGGETASPPVSASEPAAPDAPATGDVSRRLASGMTLTRHLLRSHSRDLLIQPVGAIRNLVFFTATAAGGLVQDAALDAVLVPSLDGAIPPLSGAEGMDLDAWERRLDRMTGRQPSAGTVQLLVDGDVFFERLVAEIEAAESSILFRTYIFDNDDIAIDIADRLKRRSREISVEVLVDGVGTWGGALIESPSVPADHVGPVSIASYLEEDSEVAVGVVGNAWLMGDHTKTFLFDDRLAFLGGMNIGREYRHDWHDLMVALTGPVVGQLRDDARRASAVQRWGDLAFLQRLGHAETARADSAPTPTAGDQVPLRLLYTEPYDAEIYRAQLAAIRAA
ncbi:MAG: phospholipase D-like domain-containing protein, partial [Gammaproteobacteria bacterium]